MTSVTRRAKPGRAERRDGMSERLLRAVEELLDEGSTFTEISVEQLIQRAQISRSTFYFYFEDKGELLRVVAADLLVELGVAARRWWDVAPAARRGDVRRSMALLVATYRPHARIMAAVVETSEHDAAVRAEYERLIGGYIAEMTAHIEHGQAQGSIRAELPPAETAALLCWMLERSCHELVRFADDAGAETIVDALTAVMWNTLYEHRPGAT